MDVVISLISVIAVWAALGIGIVRENERIVKISLGRPYAVAESGLFWIPFGFAWVRRYTTKVVELEFARRDEETSQIVRNASGQPIPAGGFITAPGTYGPDNRKIGPVNIGVTVSFRFNWPADKANLITCVKLLPDPNDRLALTDIFQEIILDETRSVGCKMTYLDIMSDRAGFARQITDSVTQGNASRLLIDTGIQPSARVVINHIDIPKDALDAIDDEEAQRLKAEGVRRAAEGEKNRIVIVGEGEKQRLKLMGEGHAAAYNAIKAEGPEAIELESLRTLREMAQGTSNTIFFPLEGVQKLLSSFLNRK